VNSAYLNIILALGLSALMALLSYRYKALTVSGALGMVAVGTIVMGLGRLAFATPLLFFFISSSLLSKIKTARKESALALAEKSDTRDLGQVLANGGITSLAVIAWSISHHEFFLLAGLASIAEASADTWATEIGTLSKFPPRSIISGKKCLPGESGGITFLGLTASLAGAASTAFIGLWSVSRLVDNSLPLGDYFLPATLAAFLGAIVDSILGATVQARYQCRTCRKITENPHHCRKPSELIGGYFRIDNDLVNWAGTGFAVLISGVFYILAL